MTLTPSLLASVLPASSLSINSDDVTLSFKRLTNGQIQPSIIPVVAALLEGVAKLIEQVNIQRNSSTPQLAALSLISKTIAQNQDDTGVDPTQITITYTFSFDTSTENIISAAIDPS